MKPTSILTAAYCFSFPVANLANSQTPGDSNFFQEKIIQKEVLINRDTNNSRKGFTYVSPKVLRNFSKTFRGITNEKWSESPNAFHAVFYSNDIQTSVHYDKKGTWIYTIRYYKKNDLPKAISRHLLEKYFEYEIFGVAEISCNDSSKLYPVTAYMITIESKIGWKVIQYIDGEILVVNEFEKSLISR